MTLCALCAFVVAFFRNSSRLPPSIYLNNRKSMGSIHSFFSSDAFDISLPFPAS
jgi:hypothetical protein